MPAEPMLVCELPLPPLSEAADVTLRRARVFLFSAKMPAWYTRLLLAGYTPDKHAHGIYLTSSLSGERRLDEWLHGRSRHPRRDPDLPDQIREITVFAERWLSRARAAVHVVIPDADDRLEILDFLDDSDPCSSRTWKADSMVARLCAMKGGPFYAPLWRRLEEQGFEVELPAFERALKDIQEHILRSGLEPVDLEDMQSDRERAAPLLAGWLDERASELADLPEEDLAVLALGDVVPPPGFEPSIKLLVGLRAPNKA